MVKGGVEQGLPRSVSRLVPVEGAGQGGDKKEQCLAGAG